MNKQVPVTSRYPMPWRDTCREVVEAYIKIKTEGSEKSFGATRLLNAIAEACAEKDSSFRRQELDRFVKRQHLDFWLKEGKNPDDKVFQFIDRFVRRLLAGPLGEALREKIRVAHIHSICSSMRYLYDTNASDIDISEFLNPESDWGLSFSNGLSRNRRFRGSPEDNPIFILRITGKWEGVLLASIIVSTVVLPEDPAEVVGVQEFRKMAQAFDAFLVFQKTPETMDKETISEFSGAVLLKSAKRISYLDAGKVLPDYEFLSFHAPGSLLVITLPLERFSDRFGTKPPRLNQRKFSLRPEPEAIVDEYIVGLTQGYL